MPASPDRRRKERQRRAASRRLPPVRGRGGRRFQTGGRPRSVRIVGVGQFADGLARRTGRRRRGRRRVVAVIGGVLAGIVLVLFVIARVAGHL